MFFLYAFRCWCCCCCFMYIHTMCSSMNLWRKSRSGFMYVWFSSFWKSDSDRRKLPQPSLVLASFLKRRASERLTHLIPLLYVRLVYIQTKLDRNLNFRKFLPSRSGRILEKQFFFLSYTNVEYRQRKMGGREKIILINLRRLRWPSPWLHSCIWRKTSRMRFPILRVFQREKGKRAGGWVRIRKIQQRTETAGGWFHFFSLGRIVF